jgi:hypothetical protein
MKSLSKIFKPVPGYADLEINGDGTYIKVDGVIRQTRINKFKNRPNRRYADFKGVRRYANRLVANAFIPNPENKPLVLFRNGDPTDCAYTNLEWGDSFKMYYFRVKKVNATFDFDNLITADKAKEIARKLKSGVHAYILAEQYKTSHATITRIRKHYLKEKYGNKRYHRTVKEEIFNLFDKGYTPIQISQMFNIRYETLWKWHTAGREKTVNAPSGHLRLYQLKK